MIQKGLIIFLVFFSFTGHAQKGLYITLYGLPQMSMMYNKYDSQKNRQAEIGLYNGSRLIIKPFTFTSGAGFLLKNSLSKHVLFCYGLQFSQFLQKYKIARDSFNMVYREGKIRLAYLNIPILVQYNVILKPKYLLSISVGPQISMLVSEKGAVPVYGDSFENFDLIDAGSMYKEFSFDGVAMAGIERVIYKGVFLCINGKASYGFNDMEQKKYQEVSINNNKTYSAFTFQGVKRTATHPVVIGLLVGLTVKIK